MLDKYYKLPGKKKLLREATEETISQVRKAAERRPRSTTVKVTDEKGKVSRKELRGATKKARRTRRTRRPYDAPVLSYKKKGDKILTTLTVHVAPGQRWQFQSTLDMGALAKAVQHSPEVAGHLGDTWGGTKKAVKTIGKAIGADEVIRNASRVLGRPTVRSAVPGAALARRGANIARRLIIAKAAAETGDPRARRLMRNAERLAKEENPAAQGAIRNVERTYIMR